MADLSKMSTADLEALQAGDLSKVSTAGLEHLQGPGKTASFGAGAGAEFGNIVLGGQKLLGDALQYASKSPQIAGPMALAVKGMRAVDDFFNPKGVSSIVTGKSPSMIDRGTNWLVNDARQGQARLKAENAPYAEANPISNGIGRFGADFVATAPVGGLLAKGARAVAPSLAATQTGANIIRAVETSGAQGGGLVPRSIGGAVTGAASAGVINPDDVKSGAIIGAVTPSALKLAGRAGSAVADVVRPATSAGTTLAKTAIDKYGIPLSVGDVSESGIVKGARSFLNDLPVIGRPGQALKDKQTKAFNKAVGATFGAPAESFTPQVIDQAKQRLGAEFDRIWNNNNLQVDGAMFQKLNDLEAQAAKLPQGEGGSVSKEIQDLFSKMQQDPTGAVVIPGDVANKFQSYLRRRAESSPGLRNELGDLRQTVIGAFNRSVAPSDAAALTLNRAQYKAFKTVEPLLNSAEVGVAGRAAGDVPAALLPNAVNRSYRNAAGTPLADLSAIGSRFLVDRVPRTGGSGRAMVQNSALVGFLGAGAFTNPALAGASAITLGGANKALNSPMLGRLLLEQAPDLPTGLLYRSAPLLGANR